MDATKSKAEEPEQVALFEEFLERKFHLGTGLHPELMSAFIEFLKFNANYFVWSHEDMTSILMEVDMHKLSLDPNIPPVRQKKRPIAEARNQFVKEEIIRILIRYNQIKMNPEDQEKTSFIMHFGTYCYAVMHFGLKNTGATYQRLVNSDHLKHLQETFDILRKHNMKPKPGKCSFGVSSGKFLGFLVPKGELR
uniref:Uncharacterized protein LOC104212069 n=1 Tax=Nicotiana sylvestris TaxID=4096 RepID=A0A1U7UU28_NICSY|nr:PREDICTED: uncharacterized protein LOC104212069 [Nicotiana sylvestris]